MKQPDDMVTTEPVTEEGNAIPKQLQHGSEGGAGHPCKRCGLVYSSKTAYVPCFVEGDTLETWLARHSETLAAIGHPLAQKTEVQP